MLHSFLSFAHTCQNVWPTRYFIAKRMSVAIVCQTETEWCALSTCTHKYIHIIYTLYIFTCIHTRYIVTIVAYNLLNTLCRAVVWVRSHWKHSLLQVCLAARPDWDLIERKQLAVCNIRKWTLVERVHEINVCLFRSVVHIRRLFIHTSVKFHITNIQT